MNCLFLSHNASNIAILHLFLKFYVQKMLFFTIVRCFSISAINFLKVSIESILTMHSLNFKYPFTISRMKLSCIIQKFQHYNSIWNSKKIHIYKNHRLYTKKPQPIISWGLFVRWNYLLQYQSAVVVFFSNSSPIPLKCCCSELHFFFDL